MFSVTQEIGTHLCFWFVCESACYELPEQNPICLPQGKHSYSKKCVKIRFWMGALCSGKLSVGQVIWAWKMKRNPAKCFTVLLTRCSSGSTYLPSELQQIPTYLCRGSFCLSLISEDYFIWYIRGLEELGVSQLLPIPSSSPCPSHCLATPSTSQAETGKVLPHPVLHSGEIIISQIFFPWDLLAGKVGLGCAA